jgi:Amt family ammonium transporter
VNGLWGVLSLGLFADGTYGAGWNGVDGAVRGLFYGDGGQFIAQVIGGVTNIAVIGALGWVVFKIIDVTIGLRVNAKDELEGLDVPEMGMEGYAGIKMDKNAETPLSY